MRLTLRTLLAYLDDILEPGQTKEIGTKLNESSLASSLVSRIREVMRRRRLTAPTLSGPGVGIDPNAVAEYLDNTLTPDGVADVEKICLESDVHLAEVAACHQILTLALGEPVEIPSQTRERMYALGPSAAKMSVAATNGAVLRSASSEELPSEALNDVLNQAEALTRSGQISGPPNRMVVRESPQPVVPDYLKRRSPLKGIASFAAILTVAAIWAILAIDKSPFKLGNGSDSSGTGTETASDPDDGDRVVAENANRPAVTDQVEPTEPVRSTTSTTRPRSVNSASASVVDLQDEPLVADAKTTETDATVDLPAPPDEPEEQGAPPFRRKQPPASAPTTGAASNASTKPAAPAEAETAVAAAPATPAKYVSSEGITLHYVAREQDWFVLPRRSQVHAGDFLAVPEPFECALEFEEGRGLLTLPGGTTVRWMGAQETAPTAIELRRGKLVLKATTIANDNQNSLNIAVKTFGDLWQISLQPGTTGGIDVAPSEPTGFEQESVKNNYTGGIYIANGQANLVDPSGRTIEIKGPGWIKLPVKLPNDAGDETPLERSPPLSELPKWMGPHTVSQASRQSQSAKMFEKGFKLDEAVGLSLPAVAADPNPILSKMATDTLGLIEAYGPLINVLQRTIHDEARKAAISALRMWLPRSPENRDLLKNELAQTYLPEDADVVYRLLWGFNQEDARDKAKSQQLLDWMGHPNEVSIRELAFTQVYRLTGKTYHYRASTKQPQEFQQSLKSWNQHVHRDGALLPPLKDDAGK